MEHCTNIREITPLSDKDCLYIVERKKNEFTYPVHTHNVYELNFIRNGKGIRRIVGDHISEISDLELQPRFLLQESFKKNGKTYRKIEYVADFAYSRSRENGSRRCKAE